MQYKQRISHSHCVIYSSDVDYSAIIVASHNVGRIRYYSYINWDISTFIFHMHHKKPITTIMNRNCVLWSQYVSL